MSRPSLEDTGDTSAGDDERQLSHAPAIDAPAKLLAGRIPRRVLYDSEREITILLEQTRHVGESAGRISNLQVVGALVIQTELEQHIDTKVTRGELGSRDEFVEAAVTMYRDLEEFEALRTEVGRRIDRAGQVAPLDVADLKSRLLAKWQTQDQSAS